MEISLRYTPVTGRLHTRYAPVRRSPAEYCYSPLPLDLHVLSLPLAFILSQDQTLHCKNCSFYLLTRLRVAHISIYVCRHTLSLLLIRFKSLSFSGRKRLQKYNLFPNYQNIFSKKFVRQTYHICFPMTYISNFFSHHPPGDPAKPSLLPRKPPKSRPGTASPAEKPAKHGISIYNTTLCGFIQGTPEPSRRRLSHNPTLPSPHNPLFHNPLTAVLLLFSTNL